MDDDIGYGLVRLFPEQRWKRFYLLQPIYFVLFALLFEWGVAIQDLRIGRVLTGRKSKAEFKAELKPVARKMRRQLLKIMSCFRCLQAPSFSRYFWAT